MNLNPEAEVSSFFDHPSIQTSALDNGPPKPSVVPISTDYLLSGFLEGQVINIDTNIVNIQPNPHLHFSDKSSNNLGLENFDISATKIWSGINGSVYHHDS